VTWSTSSRCQGTKFIKGGGKEGRKLRKLGKGEKKGKGEKDKKKEGRTKTRKDRRAEGRW
jgi:hypothetical protein